MRDDRIDILRFIGLAMIIFAHIYPPKILFQLRNFDVPLMVVVSAMSHGLSHQANEPFMGYVWKRIKRLVFPVWIFLTVYFLVQFVLYPANNDINFKTIFDSYALIGGIGYVWIIRVFLLIALVSQFLFHWHQNTPSNKKYFFILATCFLLYEFLHHLSSPYIHHGVGEVVSLFIFYLIPYAILFCVGLRMLHMRQKQLFILALINLGIFISVGLGLFIQKGEFVKTQALKYPPSIYYFSYALFVSSLLYIYSSSIASIFEKLKLKSIALFISRNSIWIYLWHIPLVDIVRTNFALRYFIVFTVAVAITYAQVSIVNNLLLKSVHSERARKNIKIILTG